MTAAANPAAYWNAVAAGQLRAAAWCRREAALQRKGGRMRAAEIHEAKNRIAEARWARVRAGLYRLGEDPRP